MSNSVASSFPAVAAGLRQWPSIRPGAYQLAANSGQSVADNQQMNNTPFKALPWLIIVPGAVLALLSALALIGGSSSPPVERA